MKVYIVIVLLSGDDGEVIDQVYTDLSAAERRRSLLERDLLTDADEYWQWWKPRHPTGVGTSETDLWATEAGKAYLGELAKFVTHTRDVYITERDLQ